MFAVFLALLAADPAPLTLDDVLARVASANPAVAEASDRADAASARADAAGSLPDPMAKVQQWNAPASRPLAFSQADTLMYGVEQTIPLPPKLGLRAAAARGDARASRADAARSLAEARDRAVRAFFEYWRADREVDLHAEHAALARQIVSSAQARYAAGNGRQYEVLRAQLAFSRLHADLAGAEQDRASAEAALRALLHQDEPLAKASPPETDPPLPDLPALEARLKASRPEIRAADARLDGARSARRLARAERWLPDVMIGADYWDNRMMRMGDDGWDAMVSVTLPFVWGARRAESRAAASDLRAAGHARDAIADGALAELRDAHARATAAARIRDLYRDEILPAAEHDDEAAGSAYGSGSASLLERLDAATSLLDARIAADAARARYEEALADLTLAAGEPEGAR